MAKIAITVVDSSSLKANDYNPNEMSDDGFAELVAEVKHLGRLPKPVVVRPNGEGYVIVDGEHGWRAACEAGMASIPVEIVEVDDFEAMRQTYKRNQHGDHDPVRLGQMFEAMMGKSDLSQRELAKTMEVSEGTVRNSLEYAKAVRNGYAAYAPEGEDFPEFIHGISALSLRQVRCLNRLPEIIAKHWLAEGADLKLLFNVKSDEQAAKKEAWNARQMYENMEAVAELWPYAEKLKKVNRDHYGTFKRALRAVLELVEWENTFTRYGIERNELREYIRHHYEGKWVVRDRFFMESALNTMLGFSGKKPEFLLTPDEFVAVLNHASGIEGDSILTFLDRLRVAVKDKTGRWPDNKDSIKARLAERELQKDAPDYIVQSRLESPSQREALWKADGPQSKKRELAAMETLPDQWETILLVAGMRDDVIAPGRSEQFAAIIVAWVSAYKEALGFEPDDPNALNAFLCQLDKGTLAGIAGACGIIGHFTAIEGMQPIRKTVERQLSENQAV